MTIKMNDISAKVSIYENELRAAFNRVLQSGWFILGPENKNFETAFAKYLSVDYVVGVANATDALALSMSCLLDGRESSKIATVANAGFYTATAALSIDAEVLYMDVDPSTHQVTVKHVQAAIEQGADVVVVTHLYGFAVPEIEKISELCRLNGVSLLEDCSQAHGAMVNGRKVGSWGDLSCFSFYPTKNLGALGDGGAIATNNLTYAENVRKRRQYGWSKKYHVELYGGGNSRLDELQAAVLLTFLPHLDEMNAARRNIAKIYSARISNPRIRTLKTLDDSYVGHLYVICCEQRDELAAYLNENGVVVDIHYPVPDHRQALWKGKYQYLELSNTEKLSREVLSLPCYPELPDSQVFKVVELINNWNP